MADAQAGPADRRVEQLTQTRAGEAVYRELVPLAKAELLGRTMPSGGDGVLRAIDAA